ncbi:hypothetical protein ABPG73_002976 [Tetrahymena malaccensis]
MSEYTQFQSDRIQMQQLQEKQLSIHQSEQHSKKKATEYSQNNYGLNFQQGPQNFVNFSQNIPQSNFPGQNYNHQAQNYNYPYQSQKFSQQMVPQNQNLAQKNQTNQANQIRFGAMYSSQINSSQLKQQASSSPQNNNDQKYYNGYKGTVDNQYSKNSSSQNSSYQASMSKSSISSSSQEYSQSQSQESQIKRALGCLFGAFVGDSMGSYLEFSKKPITRELVQIAYNLPGGGIFKLASGQLTDDGELAIMLAEGLIATPPENSDPNQYMVNILNRYHEWVNSKPFDFGSTMQNAWMPMNFTTYQSLVQKCQNNELLLLESIRQNAAKTSVGSESNGFLMKQSSLGIFLWNQPKETIFQYAELETKFTHINQFCIETSKIYLYILAQLIKRGKQESFKIYCEARSLTWENNFSNQMKETFLIVESQFQGITESQLYSGKKEGIFSKKDFPDFQKMYNAEKKIGWVRIPFSYSLYILIADIDVQQLYQNILFIGGDTDTNLCIAGAVYGAQNGIDAFPEFMKSTIKKCNPERNYQQPRIQKFSPGRYIELAQSLYQKGINLKQSSPKKKIQENQKQDLIYNETKNEVISNKTIDKIQNCNIQGLENCNVNKIENCYIKNISSCQIYDIKQSRLERIQNSQIKNISHSIVQDNQAQFQQNGTKIEHFQETKFGISFI